MIQPIRAFCPFLLFAIAMEPALALADHAGPGGGISTGGAVNTITAGTLDEGHLAASLRLGFNQPDRLSDSELRARDAAGVDAHSGRDVATMSAAIAFGVTHRLTLSAEIPYIRRADIRAVESGSVINRGTSAGIGDLTLLAKYRLTESEMLGVALLGGVKVPTGSTTQNDRAGDRFETEHQPGTGSWDPILGIAASLATGANAVDASFIYQRGTTGAQNTRLGDRAQAGIGLSHRFGRRPEHHDHHAHAEHHSDEPHASFYAVLELNGEWEGQQIVGGVIDEFTGARVLWLSPGARFTTASGWQATVSAGVPMAQDVRESHPDNRFRFSLSLARAF